jgi:hypothetical protein
LSIEGARLGSEDYRLELDGLFLQDAGVANRFQRLRYIESRLESANRRLNRAQVNHDHLNR